MTSLLARKRPLHMIGYGIHSEAPLFSEFRNAYDCVIMNGSMVAYSPSALAAFVSSRLSQEHGYIIDPQTHAFQHDPKNIQSSATGETKLSIRKLAGCFGDLAEQSLSSGKPLQPRDFEDSSVIDAFTDRVVSFQRDTFRTRSDKSGDLDYLEFAGAQGSLEPAAIIAPYFYMDETNVDDWLDINVAFVERAKEIDSGRTIVMQLVLSQGLLCDTLINTLVEKVIETSADAVSVWIDDFDETKVPRTSLIHFIDLLARIGKKKRILIPHGSFFSIALARLRPELNIAAVGHGLEYGESRPIAPVGGGFPVSKFYYPKVHRRLPYFEALRLARPNLENADLFLKNVCDCPICEGLMNKHGAKGFGAYGDTKHIRIVRQKKAVTRSIPTGPARDLCVRHYLYCKSYEFTKSMEDLEATKDGMLAAASEIENSIGPSNARHLRVWAGLLLGS